MCPFTNSPLRHSLSISHPDHGLPYDDAVANAGRRGDIVRDLTLRTSHAVTVEEWLSSRAVMILRAPAPISASHDRWMVVFLRPWDATDFEGWLTAQEAVARMLGLIERP